MMELLGGAFIAFVEREIVKHEPEIQKFVVDQLGKLSTILLEYVSEKCQQDLAENGLIEYKIEDDKDESFVGTD